MTEIPKIEHPDRIYFYWMTSSDKDFDAMNNLYLSGYNNWSLFLGHIVLEKLIKAFHVKTTATHPVLSHDLRLLVRNSKLDMPEDMKFWLDTITGFNINARYDSFKEDFYKRCTPEFTEEWIDKIKKIRLWIKERL